MDVSPPRTILVSNRLPITASVEAGELEVHRSVGGLATALEAVSRRSHTVWVGWPGPVSGIPRAERAELNQRLTELDCIPVTLTAREVTEYYERVSNGVLWPLFHYFTDRMPLDPPSWDVYEEVNEKFADAAAAIWREGDDIWVHDYQLLLVPALLRRRLPAARIGFFLHTPFPSSEILRILPGRQQVLDGMLGANLVGFHTSRYAAHFRHAALRMTSARETEGPLEYEGRRVRIGTFPIGIDARDFAARAATPRVRTQAALLRPAEGVRLIAGVDRLDYTKGVPRRLLTFRRLLERHPEYMGKVRFIQVVVPSRTGVGEYRSLRHDLDALVGQINGAFGTPAWTPVTYQYRSISPDELSALYAAADVMLVTPLRDGMNLVAKEFVASREDDAGVLVLSEFAGVAEEMPEALIVNPYDINATAESLEEALSMPDAEQAVRMKALRKRVFDGTAERWSRSFLASLRLDRSAAADASRVPSSPDDIRQVADRIREASSRLLLLDYDGTLAPYTSIPSHARPDGELMALLARLVRMPRTELHIVSGRGREQLDEWLGTLDAGLHAEHGLWSRPRGGSWERRELTRVPPYDKIAAILERHAERTPGALVERKSLGLAWHYRMAGDGGRAAADRLEQELLPLARRHELELLRGNKVLELRPRGIHKGIIADTLARGARPRPLMVAMGDDRTDEDLFAALPEGGIAIHVGPTPSAAPWRLADVPAARAFLEELVTPKPESARGLHEARSAGTLKGRKRAT